MNEPSSILSSFPLYPADVTALQNRLAELEKAGVVLRRARFIKALVHATPEREMLECSTRLAAAYAENQGARETDNVAARPEIELLTEDVKKLDRVKAELARKKIFETATRAFVVRAVLRWSPSGAALAPSVKKFIEEFPNKPRGLSKLRLARGAKRHD